MSATSIDLSQIKTDALSAASTFRTLIGLGTLATQSPTGTANSTTYLRGDFTWQTISAGASWGSITGTLSSQTDLQNALDAKASLSGATFTGRITTPSILLSGNYSSTAWTTSGVGLSHTARTLTDTSSTGTVATAYTNVLSGNTIAASNATTFTDYASLFIGSPTAGSNVTITNAFSLITQGAARFGGVIDTVNTQSTPLIRFNAAHPAVYFYAPYTWAIRLQNNTDTMEWGLSEVVAYKTLRLQSSLSFTTDLLLHRDAANTLAQRNGTNAQIYRIYNTYTDASNYERAKIAWSSNVLQIGTEKLGTGAARALELQTDGTTRLTISTTGAFTIADALNVSVGTTTGTKIGTATTQKLGFYNATPVVQPAAVADATDAASVITQLNLLLARMRDLGLIAT